MSACHLNDEQNVKGTGGDGHHYLPSLKHGK